MILSDGAHDEVDHLQMFEHFDEDIKDFTDVEVFQELVCQIYQAFLKLHPHCLLLPLLISH